jgi:hypothetical protein
MLKTSALLLVTIFCSVGLAADGPDILVRGGTVLNSAADYEMNGNMWVAFTLLNDSCTYVYRSTDHGLSWEYRMVSRPHWGYYQKIGLVVGDGDSAFAYLLGLHPGNNGDVVSIRLSLQNDSIFSAWVSYGPDTVRDFAVCRDYTPDNSWLYAVLAAPDAPAPRALRFFRSSTYGRFWYTSDSLPYRAESPHLSAGPGSYLYCSFTRGDTLTLLTNAYWLSTGAWYASFLTTGEALTDAVIAPAFTLPESLATVWALWSQNHQNSGDWDIKYRYSTDGGRVWSIPEFLAGSSVIDEVHPDLRNYTNRGNQYINASYVGDDDVFRRVFRVYAHAATPGQWSDTLRLNTGSAATGRDVRPRLSYTPGGPFTGAGCVFVGAGLNGLWWNAPYPSGAAEEPSPVRRSRVAIRPAVGRAPFRISGVGPTAAAIIIDCTGRPVRSLLSGSDGSAVWDGLEFSGRRATPGVYFVRVRTPEFQFAEKVILR